MLCLSYKDVKLMETYKYLGYRVEFEPETNNITVYGVTGNKVYDGDFKHFSEKQAIMREIEHFIRTGQNADYKINE